MTQLPEPSALTSVMAFHELFDAYIGGKPHLPSPQIAQLRVNLLQEELDELKQAIADGNIVEIADALTDLQYVLSGAVISFGLQGIFKDLFDEVQASNMSKACSTVQEAQQTVAFYAETKQTSGHILEKDGKYIVLRDEDNKVLKSIAYQPANLADIVHSAM